MRHHRFRRPAGILLTSVLTITAGVADETASRCPRTIEDLYGDTGDTFQAAIGFLNMEGIPFQGADASYGIAVDDVVVSWRHQAAGLFDS